VQGHVTHHKSQITFSCAASLATGAPPLRNPVPRQPPHYRERKGSPNEEWGVFCGGISLVHRDAALCKQYLDNLHTTLMGSRN